MRRFFLRRRENRAIKPDDKPPLQTNKRVPVPLIGQPKSQDNEAIKTAEEQLRDRYIDHSTRRLSGALFDLDQEDHFENKDNASLKPHQTMSRELEEAFRLFQARDFKRRRSTTVCYRANTEIPEVPRSKILSVMVLLLMLVAVVLILVTASLTSGLFRTTL